VHRPLGKQGEDGGANVAAPGPAAAPTPVAGPAAAGELVPVGVGEVPWIVSVVHLKPFYR
jgi:hypothetical protein